jgi:hypothetical protein
VHLMPRVVKVVNLPNSGRSCAEGIPMLAHDRAR